MELYTANIGFTPYGLTLPDKLRLHCMVKISDSEVLVVGGESATNGPSNKAWILDFEAETWSDAPSMTNRRRKHVCGSFVDPDSGELKVLAAGGVDSSAPETAEIFSTAVSELGFRVFAFAFLLSRSNIDSDCIVRALESWPLHLFSLACISNYDPAVKVQKHLPCTYIPDPHVV